MEAVKFPDGFIWGTATSALQIEGAWGRGESMWDRFAGEPGRIKDGTTGDVAVDHFHRWREDIALMQEVGLNAYRFSLAWTRILPYGICGVNQKGLDFYKELVDGLLEASITPYVTLYHWDLPQSLQESGGWLNRDTAQAFGEYADIVTQALGDRVQHWFTLNEPNAHAFHGYLSGNHAPGLTSPSAYARVVHVQNLAHGQAVQALRANSPSAKIGPVLSLPQFQGVSRSARDQEAAAATDNVYSQIFLEPMLRGRYPEAALSLMQTLGVTVQPDDLATIHQPIDYLGINHFARTWVAYDPASPMGIRPATDYRTPGAAHSSLGWEIYPEGIYEVLMRIQREYGNPPVLITENGVALNDRPLWENGRWRVRDERRIAYHDGYLRQIHRAMREGCNVHGYFMWTLLDTFELDEGYDPRFGLFYTDLDSLDRLPKDSAAWYKTVIASNGVPARKLAYASAA